MIALQWKIIQRRLSEMHDALFSDAFTPFMLLVVVAIFAVELAANVANARGAIALIHLIVIGSLEIAILGLLGTALVRKIRSFFQARAEQNQCNR